MVQTAPLRTTACTAPTPGLHLHQINTGDVQKAKTFGYEEATNLINEEHGTGYEITNCPPRH